MRRRAAAFALLAASAALAGCDHARPFTAGSGEPDVPYDSALPRRLTYSAAGDVEPAWLADGSGIIYSFASGLPNGDQCLGVLPPGGGHIGQTVCPDLTDADSTILLREPAAGPGGRLAYLRESSAAGAAAPSATELIVATLADPAPGRVVLRFPYTDSGGVLHGSAGQPRWLPDGDLVYIAEQVAFTFPPLPIDTIYTPLWIERLNVSGDSAVVTVIPGTASATSVAADSAGAVYYTRAGDSVVYRVAPGAQAGTPWYDFGSAGPVSGVQVHGNRLIALAGSALYLVDVAAGTRATIPVPAGLLLSRPALSPDGTRLVAEAVLPPGFPDLWLFEVP